MLNKNSAAYPEFLERDDVVPDTWDVRQSHVPRVDVARHTMDAPLGSDAHSRAVRAGLLMRAKVSPAQGLPLPYDAHPLAHKVIDACENVRINYLLRHAGIEHELDTRSVTNVIDRAVASSDVDTLVDLTVRYHGTKVGKSVARAIKAASDKHQLPDTNEFAKKLRMVVSAGTSNWNKSWYKQHLAITMVDEMHTEYDEDEDEYYTEEVPAGYRKSVGLAERVARFLGAATRRGETPGQPREGDPNKGVPEAGDMPADFADLSVERLPMPERVAGRMGRKRSATNVGINPRRAHRYYSDPERRIFDRRIKGIGGVVLIDQSGSMDLSTEEIWDVINASPGCTIIGYSHGRGSPYNCWVLAENGKVVSTVRDGNGGNGVDGPALLYALKKRKKGDPLIWVCDGYVTDRNDRHTSELADWCAKVVAGHNVHMVDTVRGAVESLKLVRTGHKLPMRATGSVEEALNRLRR